LLGSAPDEQIAQAIATERWARAADLMALHGERILLDGGVSELAGWLMALPEEYRQKSARLSALAAWVRIYDQHYQDALRHLSLAERALQQMRLADVAREADEVELRPFAELEQSLSAIRLHLRAVSDEGGALPAQVEEIMIPASADHPLWRAGALVILGRCRYLEGDLGGASSDLETAQILARELRGTRAAQVAADAAVLLGRVAEARGTLGEAATCYETVLVDPRDGWRWRGWIWTPRRGTSPRCTRPRPR
jgi:ATP/maltotriose-dependent transcriptional regulator MalT